PERGAPLWAKNRAAWLLRLRVGHGSADRLQKYLFVDRLDQTGHANRVHLLASRQLVVRRDEHGGDRTWQRHQAAMKLEASHTREMRVEQEAGGHLAFFDARKEFFRGRERF